MMRANMAENPQAQPESTTNVSQHYAGDGAKTYFDYQFRDVKRNNWVSKRFFDPHLTPTDEVVDYGAGTGWLLKLIDVKSKLAIEPNPNSREIAADLGIEAVASASEVPDDSADVVISNHALEHSLNPLAELKQMRRIVRPDGKIVICLPIDDWRKQRKPDPTDPNHHLFTWSPMLFANLLAEADFETVYAKAFSYHPSPPNWRTDVLPPVLFNAIARIRGVCIRYHQMVVVAKPV